MKFGDRDAGKAEKGVFQLHQVKYYSVSPEDRPTNVED
jgi:hypothetical protein